MIEKYGQKFISEAALRSYESQWLRFHPETLEEAPEGMGWVRNARFGGFFLEEIGTPFTASPRSETYWCS